MGFYGLYAAQSDNEINSFSNLLDDPLVQYLESILNGDDSEAFHNDLNSKKRKNISDSKRLAFSSNHKKRQKHDMNFVPWVSNPEILQAFFNSNAFLNDAATIASVQKKAQKCDFVRN